MKISTVDKNHSELESVKKIKSMAQIHIVYGTW